MKERGANISIMDTDFDFQAHIFRSPKLKSVVIDAIEFFAQTPLHILPPVTRFIGGGVYALYYIGDFELYSKLSELNRQNCIYPICVGKAVPPGWRTGRVRSSVTPDVYRRLGEHKRSLQQVTNIEVDNFRYRFIILNEIESDLVIPVEAGLIRRYRPLWNMVVDGFGNHDPGSGRYNQAKSEWDVLHPGRSWTKKLTGIPPNLAQIQAKIEEHLDNLDFS